MRSGRLGLSAIDKREIWSRWKAGETLHEIGRAYGKCHNTIRAVLLPRGGIPPLARRRSRLALTFDPEAMPREMSQCIIFVQRLYSAHLRHQHVQEDTIWA